MSIIFDLIEEDFGLERSDDKLPQKWLDLAKSNINEYPDKKFTRKTLKLFFILYNKLLFRLSLLNDFKTMVHSDPKSSKFLTEKFLLDEQYLKIYLRQNHLCMIYSKEYYYVFTGLASGTCQKQWKF